MVPVLCVRGRVSGGARGCPRQASNSSSVGAHGNVCEFTYCHAPGIFHPYFYYLLPSFFKPMITSNTRQAKGKHNSSIEDTRNAVLLLQSDYKANCRYFCPSLKRHPGPHSKLLLHQAHIHPQPTTTQQTGELGGPLQSSPSPPSVAAQRQRLPC